MNTYSRNDKQNFHMHETKYLEETHMKRSRFMTPLAALLLAFIFAATPANAQLVDFFGGKNKVNYDTFDWRMYETDHFEIYYYPEAEEHLDEVVNWAETAYEILSQRLNHQLTEKVPIIYFETHSEFQQQNVIPMFLPEAVGAFAEPRRNRLLIPLDDPPASMQALFTHELTHRFQYDILYGGAGNIASRLIDRPPLWVMEGMAEYLSDGFSVIDEMLVRDAVVNDFVPTVDEIANVAGFYIPYVYGNVIYKYIAETYGEGMVKNFVWELRKNGPNQGGVRKAFNDLFKVDTEKFSRSMRQWLRDKYLPALVEKEEPEEYGEMIRDKEFDKPIFSPVPSPSGDLVACLSFTTDDLDLMLISTKDGSLFKNLTPGYTTRWEYLIAQGVTAKQMDGHDLTWSPDGKQIALFARNGKYRDLVIIDAVSGRVVKQFQIQADQALNPAFLPNGREMLLSANTDGVRDIYLLDLDSEELTNLTEDDAFDYAPVVAPDGNTVIYTSVVDDRYHKLFVFEMNNPAIKTQLTFGPFNDLQPSFGPDGKSILFVSAETGIFNIYKLDLESGEIGQYTDVLGGTFFPSYDPNAADQGKIFFSGFLKRQYHLYSMELEQPLRTVDIAEYKRMEAERAVGFTPVVQMPIDEAAKDKQPKFDWNLDDLFAYGGVASDGSVLTIVQARFADMFGDENLTLVFNTIGNLRSYVIQYFNQKHRINWGVTIYNNNTFLAGNPNIFNQPSSVFVEQTTVENIGVSLFTRYPFNKYVRAEIAVGFNNRNYTFDSATLSNLSPAGKDLIDERFASGNFLVFGGKLVGDTARFNPAFGPISGRRWEISGQFAPGIESGDFLSFQTVTGELRNYFKLTDEMLIASRFFGGWSGGDAPDIFVFGGLNTLRGVDYLSQVGNRAFYINNELRFPLVNFASFPFGVRLNNIRGMVFFDIGGAWYADEEFEWTDDDGRLVDANAAVGFGVTFNFLNIPLNFTWSRGWDFKDFDDDYEYSFWIGPKF